ncbi:hypothetical protein [Archangium sp.]|uniref:hypothetical protein n=1 Tax=Archangium sp. TaxID=1872627 RepID=UPI00286C8E73|nr:hypothetical protein [Archangium sp.]
MVFTPDDTEWRLPVVGPGLLLDVPHEEPWNRRPFLHVEATPRYRLRVSSGGQPLLWVRIDDWWDGCGILRGPVRGPQVLPPLTAAEVRDVAHAPGSPRWWEHWTWHVGRALERSSQPVLHAGRWCLRPLRAVSPGEAAPYGSVPRARSGELPDSPQSLEEVLRFETFWMEAWDSPRSPDEMMVKSGAVLPLRAPSPEADGRVKSWRKHARDGTLPPALLLYLDIVGKWLVLDGHDRLHAALLEGVAPPLLGLWPVFEEVISVEPVRRVAITRAWPLRGGVAAWRAEVLAWRQWSHFTATSDSWAWFVSASD